VERGRLGPGKKPGDLHVPAWRDTPEERDQGGAERGAEAKFERLQHRHVGLALPVLLDALPAEDPDVGATQSGGSEEFFRERCLADPCLTRDEDDLSRPPVGDFQASAEPAQLRPPSDKCGTGLLEGGVVRQRRGQPLAGQAPRFAFEPPDLGHQAKAAPVDGLDDPRRSRAVVECPAEFADRLGERVVGDDDIGPNRAVEGLLGNEQAGPLDQIVEHVPRFGTKQDFTVSPPQPVASHIQVKGVERERPAGGEWRRVAHRPSGTLSGKRSAKSREWFRIRAAVLCKSQPW
jgi:hypothetical protein